MKTIRPPQTVFCTWLATTLALAVAFPVPADEVDHAADDAFAAEVQRLAPAFVAPFTAASLPGNLSTTGQWGSVIAWTPHIPVSAANLPDGRILTFASNQRTSFPSGPEFTYAATWNPATGQFLEFNHPSHDMFCGALVMLPDGRVLVNGGRNTTVRSSLFDWRVNTWTRTPDMNDPRWYNTSVALPNGRVWTVSGSGGSGTAERWDEAIGWSRLTGINWNTVTSEPGYITIWHPFLSLAPDGRLIHFGPTDTMHWVLPDGSGAMSNTGTTVPGAHYPKEGSWVMYDEGRILVAGGGANTTNNPSDTTTGTSSRFAYTVDVRGGTPIITQRNPMAFARQFANCVVLPNGEVMVMGGNTSGLKFNDTGSILTPEIWNPTTGLWRNVANMSVPRNYHSLALLLPDGRVMSGGGGLGGGDHQDAQLFTPPNLFNGDGTFAARPSINTAPTVIGVATRFTVTGTPGIQKFSFIKMSAITHSVNSDLRYLSLPFTEVSPGTYELTAHSSLNVMTPGYWMLFGLNAAGAHSVAKTILVDAINAVNVAVPGNQASYVNQAASLQMLGSGPVGSVLNWSATGLPNGLSIGSASGLISGTPTVLGTFNVHVTATDGSTSDFADFTWTIQPSTFSQNFPTFASASGLTLNGNALVTSGALRLTGNVANQRGSAFLSTPLTIGSNSSLNTRFVFRVHGTANGADGLTFVIQGNSASSLGTAGSGLGYGGIGQSLAIEIDNQQGTGDPNANHLGILTNGNVTAHLATFTTGWDLENAASHTIWVEYDGPSNQLRVYAAQGNVTQRPATAAMTVTVDLPALVGGQAWFGFTGATGSAFNNHDIQSWSLILNAFALPAPPVLTAPGDQTTVVDMAVSQQMQASDPNGDLLTWSAAGLPTGLTIDSASGLISGTPTIAGVYFLTVTVTDSNTPPVSTNFTWTINNLLAVQSLAGTAVAAGSTVALTAQASGGLNPQYRWSFGDGTPDTSFSSSPSKSHLFSTPGRYLVTVTVRDDTGREVTGSYRQGVYAPPTAARPTASASIAYERRTGLNSRLWVVNQDNDSVTVFDAVTRAKLAEVNVGQAPRSLALAPNGRVWVVNADEATLTLVRSNNYTIAQTISLPRGSRPYGVVFDPAGANAYVALENGGKVLKLHPTTGATIASLEVGLHVRHLSVTADGARILATRFVTPRLPGEDTANVQTTVGGVDYGGEVLAINTATFTVEDTIILKHGERPDTSNSAKGIPNYLGGAAISPDGLTAWVPSKQDNIKRGSLRNGGVLTHDMTVRSIASRIVLASQSEDLAGRIDFDDAGIASAAAFDPNGLFLFTAMEGSREVAVADAWGKQEILRFETGRAPQGLVLSPDGRTLFVHNFMDRNVTIHDLNALANGSETPPPAPILLDCVATEKLNTNVLRGKQFFYDTRDNRVAFQQYVSCAGCHNDGGQDGRVWDFTQFGEGLRNTITLRGHGGTAQGPLHWTGNFDEVQDFEGQIRNFALGTGLMSDADFHAGTRSQSLGDSKTGLSADLDALAAYVSSLTAHGDSPDRNTNGSLTAAALAGQAVFQQKNCAQCHSGAQFTDSALNVFHDVGTLKPSSGQRLGAPLSGLDTPTLLGLYNTAPYLHNGSAATIEEAVSAHSGVTLNATEMSNLAAFLRQLDDAGVPLPATITWGNPSAITYGTALSSAQLNATANVPGTFVYSPPGGTVLNAGNGQTLSVTFTPDDLTSYSPATDTVTINVLRAPLTITAQNKSKIYGAALPAFTLTYSGFVNGDSPSTLNTPPGLSTAATAGSSVGNYAIVASGAVDPNYAITHINGSLSVTPALLTITANSTNKVYGAALPVFTASYSGFVNGDTAPSLNTPVSLATPATAGSAVGNYPITAGGAADANYTITHINGSLSVTPALLTITANSTNKVYGAALPALTASYNGLDGSIVGGVLWVEGHSGSALQFDGLTGYAQVPSTASLNFDRNSSFTIGAWVRSSPGHSTTGMLLSKRGWWTEAGFSLWNLNASASRLYASLVDTDGDESGWLVNDNGAYINDGGWHHVVMVVDRTRQQVVLYTDGIKSAPYNLAAMGNDGIGDLTSDAPFTIGGALYKYQGIIDEVRVYGAALSEQEVQTVYIGSTPVSPPGVANLASYGFDEGTGSVVRDGSYNGLVNGDTPESLDVPVSLTTPATAASPVGAYPITASGAADANYTITHVNGSLTVAPALLTITAQNKSKIYGAALPAFTLTYSGFVNGDSPSTLNTPPGLSTAATAGSSVGNYAIVASGAVDPNYAITHINGSLSVTPALLTITANSTNKVYGAALPVFTASYSGFVNGDTAPSLNTPVSLATPATAGSAVGNYPITAGGAADANYTITHVNGSLTVTPALLTITANSTNKVYGAALPVFTASYSGFVNGDTAPSLNTPVSLATAATASSAVGNYPITAGGAADANYTITHVNGSLSVTPALLTITANSTNKVYGAALPVFTASYSGFVNGDTAPSLNTPVSLATPATAGSAVGNYPITAGGAADANYTITHVNGTLTVEPAASVGIVSSSENPALLNQEVTFTLALSALPPAIGTPTGTVQFLVDGSVATNAPVNNGLASYSTTALQLGTHTVITEYAGDPNFTRTTNTLTPSQVINEAPRIVTTISNLGDGSYRLMFIGVPGRSYTLQYTDELNPANWQTLSTGTASPLGVYEYVDTPPAGSRARFYRSIYQ